MWTLGQGFGPATQVERARASLLYIGSLAGLFIELGSPAENDCIISSGITGAPVHIAQHIGFPHPRGYMGATEVRSGGNTVCGLHF